MRPYIRPFVSFLVSTFAALPICAQTLDELKNDSKNTDNVLTYGMGYHQNRYSTLKQVNKQTVKRLAPVWNVSLASNYGEQAQPLVYNGVMYVTNAEYTVAIDIETGQQLWRTPVDWDPATPRVVCCGVSNKGPAIYSGKVFRGTLDAHVFCSASTLSSQYAIPISRYIVAAVVRCSRACSLLPVRW